jgi:hypothetical protein
MINNRFNNTNENDDQDSLEKSGCEIEGILAETNELRKIAARTILRSSVIMDNKQDEDVAQMLLLEAAVMMSLIHRIENFFTEDGYGK